MGWRSTPSEVVPSLTGTFLADQVNIRCPNCGSDYTHIRHAGTLVGSDEGEATVAYSGTGPSGTTAARRSALEVVFECEGCTKLFALVIQQVKGVNHFCIEDDVDIPDEG
jgi:hypothetical protein